MKRKRKVFAGIGIAALCAGAVYGINRLAFFISTMKDILNSKNKSFYRWRFGDIYYSKQGEGRPVLLIHALDAACSDYEWQDMVKRLSNEYTVYTIDLPGCGRSGKEKMIYTNYLYVQAVNDFLKHFIKSNTDINTSGHTS